MSAHASHTPGPWVTRATNCSDIGLHTRVAKFWPGTGAYQIIADCSHDVTRGTDCEANATLTAAAPDLLAAAIIAEEYIRGFEGDEMQDEIDDKLAILRAAIVKAKGLPVAAEAE